MKVYPKDKILDNLLKILSKKYNIQNIDLNKSLYDLFINNQRKQGIFQNINDLSDFLNICIHKYKLNFIDGFDTNKTNLLDFKNLINENNTPR